MQVLPLRGALLVVLSTGQDSSTPQAFSPSACPSAVPSLAKVQSESSGGRKPLRTEGEIRMYLKYNGANNH